MGGFTRKSRAVALALCAGATGFGLTLLATFGGRTELDDLMYAVIAAIVCAAMSWASAMRAIASNAGAIDAAIARLSRAARGDLQGEIPAEIDQAAPELAHAMEGLFSQLSANLDNVHRLAMFDPVTALPNRTHFRRTCERVLGEMGAGKRAALFFIDLDRFKSVNDTMGHASGDMLLRMVADRLEAVCERFARGNVPRPLLGRLAGDEFTMFFPDIGERETASRIGRRILFALNAPFDVDGTEIAIGASIGIALRPEHGDTLGDLMRAADAAMYQAKAGGGGRAEYFTERLAAQLVERMRLENELRQAVGSDQFALVFQPQVSIAGGQIVAAEALLRWRHPRDGLRYPASFLERAEETGLIVEIGEWVIGTVAATIARWARMGIEQRLAINISRRQLDHAGFFHKLRAAMHEAAAPAHLLELEITETLAINCSEDVVEAIAALRADGATIAVDDFGTGYSNLGRLRALPVDRVKLHRSLVAPIADNAEARTIAQALIGLIHGLGCEVVGEGIETRAQADVLRVIGCDVIQGYAIAPPMEEHDFIAWAQRDGRMALQA